MCPRTEKLRLFLLGLGVGLPLSFLVGTWLWKLLLTVVTIACGFKGGEVVPSFFIGATFGCVVGAFLGLDPGFAAAAKNIALQIAAGSPPTYVTKEDVPASVLEEEKAIIKTTTKMH